jgi:hypothetical protein
LLIFKYTYVSQCIFTSRGFAEISLSAEDAGCVTEFGCEPSKNHLIRQNITLAILLLPSFGSDFRFKIVNFFSAAGETI